MTGHLAIEGETHLLFDGEDAMICRRLVVQESIVKPARSQMDIPTKTVYSNLKAMRDAAGTIWMTESGETVHGLQIARTLVPNRQGNECSRPSGDVKEGSHRQQPEQVNVITPTKRKPAGDRPDFQGGLANCSG